MEKKSPVKTEEYAYKSIELGQVVLKWGRENNAEKFVVYLNGEYGKTKIEFPDEDSLMNFVRELAGRESLEAPSVDDWEPEN